MVLSLRALAQDAPEYTHRIHTPFKPAPLSLKMKDLYAVVPRHLFESHTGTTLYYVLRSTLFLGVSVWLAYGIEGALDEWAGTRAEGGWTWWAGSWALWSVYWTVQGIVLTGFWVLGASCYFNSAYKLDLMTMQVTRCVLDRKSTRLNSSHSGESRMPSSA